MQVLNFKRLKMNIIALKWWTLKSREFEEVCESSILINALNELEDYLRWDNLTHSRREFWNETCFYLMKRAIEVAPEWTRFYNDRSWEEYNKEQAIDYIMNYDK